MPMLTTVVIRSPVAPVHSPERTRSANARHPVEHLVHVGDHVLAVHDEARVARQAQRGVQHGPVLGDVDVLAGEHRGDPLAQPGPLGERDERRDGLVGDQVLAVVEVELGGLDGQARAALRVGGEELTERRRGEGLVLVAQRAPGSRSGEVV